MVQLGPLVLGSSSGEMFAQYGLDFKAQAPFPFVWYSQLSRNLLGYVPTADCFLKAGGGYETSTSKFVPDTGNEVIHALIGLAQQLSPEASPESEKVAPATATWGYNFVED